MGHQVFTVFVDTRDREEVRPLHSGIATRPWYISVRAEEPLQNKVQSFLRFRNYRKDGYCFLVPGFVLFLDSCFSAFLLLCFSCFSLFCFPLFAFPALLLCFSACLPLCLSLFRFSAFSAFAFPAFLLFCFCAFLLPLFLFSHVFLLLYFLLLCFSASFLYCLRLIPSTTQGLECR